MFYRQVLLAVIASVLMFGGAARSNATVYYYVATNGSDTNPGTYTQPFATIDHARAVVAALAHPLTSPVTVLIEGGTYWLTSPLLFQSQDSGTFSCPVTYKAYNNQSVVVDAGYQVNGTWTQYNGNIYKCSVASINVTTNPIRHLFYNDEEQPLARYPNYDPQNPLQGGYMFTKQPASNSNVIQWNCQPSDWVEYTVNVPANGVYYLWTYYAGHPGTASVQLSVDGGLVVATYTLPTQNYLTFNWSPRGQAVSLSAGSHRIRFTAIYGHDGFYPKLWAFCNSTNYNPSTNSVPTGAHAFQVASVSFSNKQTQMLSDGRDSLEIGYDPVPDLPQYKTSATLPAVHSSWVTSSAAEMVVFNPDEYDWLTDVVSISSVDTAANTVTFAQPTLNSFSAGRRCYIRNVFEELDSPGEWYLDTTTSTLYFWSPDGVKPANGGVVLCYLNRVLQLQGDSAAQVSYLNFSGLTFRGTTAYELGGIEFPSDCGVQLYRVNNCTFSNCHMVDLAANAIEIDPSCSNITIEGCEIYGAGACGILQPPVSYFGAVYSNLHIVGNDIHDCGKLHKGTGAVELYYGGNTVEYNYLHDLPRWGVAFPFNQGGQNTIRYNEIRRACLETADCGPIHNSPSVGEGGEINNNLLIDCPGMSAGLNGTLRTPFGCWGIYLDCQAPGYNVHDNAIVGPMPGGYIVAGPNNTFENNMVVNCGQYQAMPRFIQNTTANVNVLRNIFYYTDPTAQLYRLDGEVNVLSSGNNQFDYNLIFHNGLPISTYGASWESWNALGGDVHSTVADPLFVNLAAADFRLQSGSPATALDIHGLDFRPTITTQPQSQAGYISRGITLSVVATNVAPRYQWYFEPSGSGTFSAISGATGPSYTLDSAGFADAGSYYCIVTNSTGSVTSNIATITVQDIAPSTPIVTDDGTYTPYNTSLHVTWAVTSAGTGISQYEYAIGTSPTDPGSGYLVGWTSTGTNTSVTKGLPLASGVPYYIYVKAQSVTGLWSGVGVSDGIIVDATPPSTPAVTDDGAYTISATCLHVSWIATDAQTGISQYQYAIGTSPTDPGSGYISNWTTASGTSATKNRTYLSGITYYFYVKAKNGAGAWSSVGVSDGITVDTTPPSAPVVTDGSAYTSSNTSLHASWTATDAQSGIAGYKYAIGTSPTDPGSGYTVSWTSVSTASATANVSLTKGVTYYFYVKAKNGAGTWGSVGVSDGILAVSAVAKISDVRAMATGSYFVLPAKNVGGTSSGLVFIEEPDRSCGLKLNWSGSAPDISKTAVVAGIYRGIVGNEPTADVVSVTADSSGVASPLGMKNNSVGWPGLSGFSGVDTRCLLVTVWGKVTYTGSGLFLLDDGSALTDYLATLGQKGIEVLLPSGAVMPSLGGTVAVTGLSRASLNGKRWIMPRAAADIR